MCQDLDMTFYQLPDPATIRFRAVQWENSDLNFLSASGSSNYEETTSSQARSTEATSYVSTPNWIAKHSICDSPRDICLTEYYCLIQKKKPPNQTFPAHQVGKVRILPFSWQLLISFVDWQINLISGTSHMTHSNIYHMRVILFDICMLYNPFFFRLCLYCFGCDMCTSYPVFFLSYSRLCWICLNYQFIA